MTIASVTTKAAQSESVGSIVNIGNLFKSFGDLMVLKNINFAVNTGDVVSIIGASGCGKSTLLRCMDLLDVPDSGIIEIAGTEWSRTDRETPINRRLIAEERRLRSQVGMVFQGMNLFPHKTILDNITLAPMTVKGTVRSVAEEEAMTLLKSVGLQDFAKHYPATLSGGQAQRAAIARALAMSPKVMLYDEPTSALDPALVDDVLGIMKDLDKGGMTQIVVTHEMRFAREVSDSIMFIENGEIVEISDHNEIFEHPKEERTRKFLSHL